MSRPIGPDLDPTESELTETVTASGAGESAGLGPGGATRTITSSSLLADAETVALTGQPGAGGIGIGIGGGDGGGTVPLEGGNGEADPPVGSSVLYLGDYELLSVLGRGGMGVVYRARQVSLSRLVALKLIRSEGLAGLDEIRRFLNEAEAVAQLDHAGIVPIYEVGEHDGRHYFSMKLIEGVTLGKALGRYKGDYWATASLVAAVAEAIQHAHRRGILHRDLKPSNILLDAEGRPHVGDFGLAKRVDVGPDDSSLTGAVVGTPAYMAPEQTSARRGAITTLTDVYGIGAILYAMLTGHGPHRGSSVLEVLDDARERVPSPPSAIDPKVPRDLDLICRKCLEIDPNRRYRSAEALGEDLVRFVEGRPIEARRVGLAARAGMWSKRNPLVTGLVAALVVAILAGSIGVVVNWLEVRRRRDQLALELRKTQAIKDFLAVDVLQGSSPHNSGRHDLPVSTLLERSATAAGARFSGDPEIEAAIRLNLGEAFLGLGLAARAEAELLRGLQLAESLAASDPTARPLAYLSMARLRNEQERLEDAESFAIRALDGLRMRVGERQEVTLSAAALLAAIQMKRGRVEEAEKLAKETYQLAKATLGAEHRLTLHILSDLGAIAHMRGRVREADETFRTLDEIWTRRFGPEHPATIMNKGQLGVTAFGLEEFARAEGTLAQALDPARRTFGESHPDTLRITNNLAAVLIRLGRHGEAAKLIEQAAKALAESLPADHLDRISADNNRAMSLLRQRKPAEAEAIFRDVLARARTRFSPDDPTLGTILGTLVGSLWEQGKDAEAEPFSAEGIAILRKTYPEDDSNVVDAEAVRAVILLKTGGFEESARLARHVLEVRSRPQGVDLPWTISEIRNVLGSALASRKQYAEAEPLLLGGYEGLKADPKAPSSFVDAALERVIWMYEAQGRPEEAATWRSRRRPRPAP